MDRGDKPPQPVLLHAVDDVSFSIEAGESVGLVGESGCGKSTLARLIARLIDPTSGDIRFQGRDLGCVPAQRFARSQDRRLIQQVFQDPTESLNPRFTASQTIGDPLKRLLGLRGAALWTRVGELAELVNFPSELLDRYPHQLSGGQKARVGIARALASKPILLILDEPTSALDVSVQGVILKLLAELRRQLGMSVLFISHDLNVVRLMCDRVFVMYLGKFIEAGPAWQVFEQPQHPYTRALVSAIPTIDAKARRRRIRLDGEPVSPIAPDPRMCRFYGRCWRQTDRCRVEMPSLMSVDTAHLVACHFPEGEKTSMRTAP
ncbi:MAG: ABC transporter ATP-binding protein [Nitrospinae bacterium]|nr:ABC transporter ATP-binding protein [Nitrospinota bacterium]